VISRHRTNPWADAILLVADTVVLSSRGNSHIVCPQLDQPLVLTFGAGNWQCRQGGAIAAAGQPVPLGAPLPTDRLITIEGVSMTLETIQLGKSYA
jgi:hypothetical protein